MAELLDDLLIRFPARSGYLSISRLTTTAMAASVGFDVEELDDLRLAIDEAVNWLLADVDDQSGAANGSVELTISCEPGRLRFTGRRTEDGLEAEELDDLVQAILGATVDDYETGVDEGGHRYIALAKQRVVDG